MWSLSFTGIQTKGHEFHTQKAKVYRIVAFFAYNSCLAIFLTYGLFFNDIASDLNQSPASTALVFGIFAILYGFSSVLMGFLLDRIGPSKTILLGGILMGSGLLLSSPANSLLSLVATFGVIGGAGTGSMWPATSYSVFEKFDHNEIGNVTGVVSAGVASAIVGVHQIASFWRNHR